MLKDSKNYHESHNIHLDYDIQRYLDVSISYNLDNYEFGIKDAIPISLNLESFIFIKSLCIHNILHNFKLPIKAEIKWKIIGGIANGAFKIGNGMDAEFFPRDSGDSVIFYPQLQNMYKNTNYKQICIELTVKQLGSDLFEEREYQFIVTVNILIIKKSLTRTFIVKMFITSLEDNSNNKKDSYIKPTNDVFLDDGQSDTCNKLKKEEGKNYVTFRSTNNCKICNLSIIQIDKTSTTTNISHFFIKFLKSYLITSEIIKISAESNNTKNISMNKNSLLLTGNQYKKYFINGIQLQPKLFWKSNIGGLAYGNLGQSAIYYTPDESELSKSPVKLNLYYHYDHGLKDLQHAHLSDSKKLWILRQPPLMGG